jgi:cell division protein FtsB
MSSPALPSRSRLPRVAEVAVARARLRVVPRRRPTAPRVPFVVLVSLVLVAGVVGLLMFNTSLQQASFSATNLEEQASTLTAREQVLAMELEALRDPQHVARQAQRMGMVLPAGSCFVSLSGDSAPCSTTPRAGPTRLRLDPAPPVKPAVLAPKTVTVAAELGEPAAEQVGGNRGRR